MKSIKWLVTLFAFLLLSSRLQAQSLEETYDKLCVDAVAKQGETCIALGKSLADKQATPRVPQVSASGSNDAPDAAIWGPYAQVLGKPLQWQGGRLRMRWRWQTPGQVLLQEFFMPNLGGEKATGDPSTVQPGSQAGTFEWTQGGHTRLGTLRKDGSVLYVGGDLQKPWLVRVDQRGNWVESGKNGQTPYVYVPITESGNPATKAEWAQAVQAGDADALRQADEAYERSFSFKPDALRALASGGNVFAALMLEYKWKPHSYGTVRDGSSEHERWHDAAKAGDVVFRLRALAETGSANAQTWLGTIAHDGLVDDGGSFSDAAYWYRMAADQGHAPAQFRLGELYENGEGLPKDAAEAFRWYRKAAEQGYARAQFNLGGAYQRGIGTPANAEEAVRWYRKSAEQGNAFAQNNLGQMYAFGSGIPANVVEGLRWYRAAADQGFAPAQINLGQIYRQGDVVPVDIAEAQRWYRMAWEQGVSDALYKLQSVQDELAEQAKRQRQKERSDRLNQALGAAYNGLKAAEEVATENEAASRALLDATLAQATSHATPATSSQPATAAGPGVGSQIGVPDQNKVDATRGAEERAGPGAPLRFVLSIGLQPRAGDKTNPTCYSTVVTRGAPGPGWGTGQMDSDYRSTYANAKAEVDAMKSSFIAACRSTSGRDITSEGNFHWTWNETRDGDAQIANTHAQYGEDITVSL
jgi:TPR repeat protein